MPNIKIVVIQNFDLYQDRKKKWLSVKQLVSNLDIQLTKKVNNKYVKIDDKSKEIDVSEYDLIFIHDSDDKELNFIYLKAAINQSKSYICYSGGSLETDFSRYLFI